MGKDFKSSPWAWIPTLYFAQGLPYVAVMTISVIMYKRLGISNTDIALYTGWLYLPWVIKPFWSPFVDIIKTKRWWTIAMQWMLAVTFAGVAFTIPAPFFFRLTLAVFWIMGFTSATHDIAADGFYMLALDKHQQSLYVGIRSTFYRIATVAGQGLLVIIAGLIETNSGLQPVEITVQATPSTQTTAATIPHFGSIAVDTAAEPQFIFTTPYVTASTTAPTEVCGTPFKTYVAALRDSVQRLNEVNGFTNDENGKSATSGQSAKNTTSPFTLWIKNAFGEKRAMSTDGESSDNIAIVGVRLSKMPHGNEPVVLNITHNSGDPSITLQSTRFEFTHENFDKTAYLFFTIDHKIKEETQATFIGASGNIPFAWTVVFTLLSGLFFAMALYHSHILPHPVDDTLRARHTAHEIIEDFALTFVSFFKKKQIWVAIAFMLLYRLPEAQLGKMSIPFLLDPIGQGGLGMTTAQIGFTQGTVGIIGLTIGGILGGMAVAKHGLQRWLWPMVWAISLPDAVYVYLSYAQPADLLLINSCIFIEQFGYGFGFTAYMLYLIHFSEGQYKTAHYAICTAFMALGMMIPGMMAGWIQEFLGYRLFFIWIMICTSVTFIVTCRLKNRFRTQA